MEMNKILTRS